MFSKKYMLDHGYRMDFNQDGLGQKTQIPLTLKAMLLELFILLILNDSLPLYFLRYVFKWLIPNYLE